MKQLVAVVLAVLATRHATAALQLTPVVSGLSSPLYVTSANDGSGRLYIVEKAGVVKVLARASTTPTVFLDLTAKVMAPPLPSEQGMLGLVFHPGYPADPRFYVSYTRKPDGAIVLAQYSVTKSPAIASTVETPILTILHPNNTNHNGGMLAFGPDGYLYVSTGDGGGSNDPANNAQNKNVLLGKLLRIDVDHPNGDVPYSSPASNPFFGATDGADEVFAYGLRNPWRFSFDRATGQLWVGDVGQGAREEVDTPIQSGGNYGWRVYEGNLCTNNDPQLCDPANYLFPILDYAHTSGRCAITGGYVYRGTAAPFAQGTYVYGDYCTGEIFTWNGVSAVLALDTSLGLSSFGEDEGGELYAVGIAGTVSRLTSSSCAYTVNDAALWVGDGGASWSRAVTVSPGCAWRAVASDSWISVTSGASGTGDGEAAGAVAPLSGPGRAGSLAIAGHVLPVYQAGVADVFALINFLFAGAPAPPAIRDVNADGITDVLDVFTLINVLFAGAPPPG